MKILKFLLFPLYCLVVTGCASIIHGTRQEVSISTDPTEALVSDGTTTIKTPGKLNLERDKDHILTITKPGYNTESVRITHVVSGAVFANILAGGFIGWGVDAVSGAQWRLEPETLSVTLNPAKPGEQIDASLRPTLSTLEDKLNELERLKEKKAITEEEYKAMRDIAIQSTLAQSK